MPCDFQVCAVLFCWSGLLGMVGGIQALLAECFARQRSSAQAAASSLGLKASTPPHADVEHYIAFHCPSVLAKSSR